MAFCTECGASITDGVKFCPACGKAQATSDTAPSYATAPSPQQNAADVPWGQPAAGGYTPPPASSAPSNQVNTPLGDINFSLDAPVVGEADPRDVVDNKAMAILSYILFFVPLIAGTHKTSPYVRFHVNQGTVLFIASLIYYIALAIIAGTVLWVLPWSLYFTINSVFTLLRLIPLVLVIVGIVNAANGKLQQLPIIGGLSIIK